MMRQYDKQEIARILGKFMAGETSLDEEQLLAEYFRTHEVSDEWQEYKEMFALFDSGAVDIEPEEETKHQANVTDAKVRKLPQAVNEKSKITPIRWLMTGIAASVLLLLTLQYNNKVESPIQQSHRLSQTKEISTWQYENELTRADACFTHQMEIKEKGERLAAYIHQQTTIDIQY
ncbi:MAG: hypothetical protein IJ901_06095 [Bacteroidaceae bacterium]|jgi:hypothetical protein|nr:hypothetical protein [Bacteroidaceae bacterium]